MEITVNGARLFYIKAGQGSPVVLLHGNNQSHRIFDLLIRQLKRDHTVYALDSRGQGRSETGDRPLTYGQMARDTAAFIRLLGLRRPALYGFSDGGIVGLLLAIHHPELLSRLAVSGANAQPHGLKARWQLIYRFMGVFGHSPLTKMIVSEPNITAQQLEQIRIPVLVLAGQFDMVRQEHTRWLAQHIPGGRLQVVRGASHGSYVVRSPRVYHYLKDFLAPDKLPASRSFFFRRPGTRRAPQ